MSCGGTGKPLDAPSSFRFENAVEVRFRLDECRYNIYVMFYFRQTGRVQGAKFSQAGIEFLRDKTRWLFRISVVVRILINSLSAASSRSPQMHFSRKPFRRKGFRKMRRFIRIDSFAMQFKSIASHAMESASSCNSYKLHYMQWKCQFNSIRVYIYIMSTQWIHIAGYAMEAYQFICIASYAMQLVRQSSANKMGMYISLQRRAQIGMDPEESRSDELILTRGFAVGMQLWVSLKFRAKPQPIFATGLRFEISPGGKRIAASTF